MKRNVFKENRSKLFFEVIRNHFHRKEEFPAVRQNGYVVGGWMEYGNGKASCID